MPCLPRRVTTLPAARRHTGCSGARVTVGGVTPRAADAAARAERLLDAQVRYHLDRLTGDRQAGTVARLTHELLGAAGNHQLATLVDPQALTALVERALLTVPGSAVVASIVELVTQVVSDGPPEPFPLGEAVDRDQVEALGDRLRQLTPAVEQALDRLADSPLVGTVASRFMGRIVGEVLAANQAVAAKVPGLGPLMSFGTSTASRLRGAADKQFDALLGDTVGKGGTYAVRRLNRILIDTLRDPITREAALQVWDQLAAEPVAGLGDLAAAEEIADVVEAARELAVTTLASPHAGRLARALVEAFLDWFGGYTPTEVLDELGLPRDDLVAEVARLAPWALDTLHESGDLERLVRAQLEPFYASAEVAALLR